MKEPIIKNGVYLAKGAVVSGDVTLCEDVNIWYHASIRGDRDKIVIHRSSNVQDNAVIHVDEGFPVILGEKVTIGHGAVIHGCKIGDNSLIGMGAVILNGAVIGKNCIVGAGALVTQNAVIPDNSLVIGSPGKVKRSVTEEEILENCRNAMSYVEEGREYQKIDQL